MFDIKAFLSDVNKSDINELVTGTESLEAAAGIFENKFKFILDFHAPMKTFQIRKNYSPFISQETKDMISERKVLQEEVTRTGNSVLLREFRYKCKEVKWIKFYLSNRTQSVQVEFKLIESLDCGDHGAPQGSILDGLLHVINSNDFQNCHEEGAGIIYVDDDNEPADLKIKIQKEVNNSVSWLQDNRFCVADEVIQTH